MRKCSQTLKIFAVLLVLASLDGFLRIMERFLKCLQKQKKTFHRLVARMRGKRSAENAPLDLDLVKVMCCFVLFEHQWFLNTSA